MRMIEGAGTTCFPNFGWQNQPRKLFPVFPPPVPEQTQVRARRFSNRIQIRRIEESGDTEKQRFAVLPLLAQESHRQTLREQCEWQPILFVAKRLRYCLEQDLLAPMCFDALAKAIRFLSQTKLRGSFENTGDAF